MRSQLKDQKGRVELLPVVEHEAIAYEEFTKDFYSEPQSLKELTDEQVAARRRELNLRCSGFDVPKPLQRFDQARLSRELSAAVRRHGYDEPTPIQCQALPVALSGRDMIGIASTGSGKTAAFVLPMLTHVMAQPELRKGDGPIALILAPTHELAEQIVKEARRFAKPLGVRCTAVFGGVGKYEQFKELKAGVEVVVATPGRLIELIGTKGALSMARVTYVVIDEADRMFSLGFEQQVLTPRSAALSPLPPRRSPTLAHPSPTPRPTLTRLLTPPPPPPAGALDRRAGAARQADPPLLCHLQAQPRATR